MAQTVGGQTTDYLWDEASTFGDVAYETTGASITSYVLGGTELLSQTRDGVTSYYLHDGQTSIRDLTDPSGAVTNSYDYSAYGELLSQTGSAANAYLYTGQQFDSETGLYSLRARYHDPGVGNLLTQDTLGYSLTAPAALNRYTYVSNDPINELDPSGLQAFTEYSELNENSEEEAQILGAEVRSEATTIVDETEALLRNAGDIGDDVIQSLGGQFYGEAVQNPESDIAAIGKYVRPGGTAPYESYEAAADRLGASHINLKEPYLSQYRQFFGGGDQAWRAFINKPYLEGVANAGKPVIVTTPPDLIGATSTTQWEIDTLVGLGYSEPVADPATGLWIMLPK